MTWFEARSTCKQVRQKWTPSVNRASSSVNYVLTIVNWKQHCFLSTSFTTWMENTLTCVSKCDAVYQVNDSWKVYEQRPLNARQSELTLPTSLKWEADVVSSSREIAVLEWRFSCPMTWFSSAAWCRSLGWLSRNFCRSSRYSCLDSDFFVRSRSRKRRYMSDDVIAFSASYYTTVPEKAC